MAFRAIVRCLITGLWLSLAGTAAGGESPRLLFSADGRQFPVVGQPVAVGTRLVQVSLGYGLVLAAGQGANFLIDGVQDGGTGVHVLTVARGPALAIDTARQKIERLERGSYLILGASGPAATTLQPLDGRPSDEGDSPNRNLALRQGFQLGDAIMTRQQAYLDSIRIDVRDINRAFSSLLRAIAGK